MMKFTIPSAVAEGLILACNKREFLYTELHGAEMKASEVFDDFFRFTEFREGDLRVIKNGKALADTTFLEPKIEGPITMRIASKEKLSQFFNEGYTLVFGNVNNKSEYFYNLSACINEVLGVKTWINCYLTPAGMYGFDAHADDHDVLVIQASGSKTWIVEDFQGSSHHIVMKDNSLMYIPQGMMHQAVANHAPSLHYTIGFNVDTVFSRIMPYLYNALLPYADMVVHHNEIDTATIQAVKASLIEVLDNSASRKYEPIKSFHLTGLLNASKELAAISDNTDMRLAKAFQVHIEGDVIKLMADVTLQLPVAYFPLVQKIKMLKTFTPKQLSEGIDAEVLPYIRQLLSAGFITAG